ncbi:MAG TPA: ATP-binding cassette domain-containing protein [Bacteroidia bacterium]|jgi:ABC-2 type transport system ATP-binding protein|nr:ATP-binding cassette domain-containing protein [Bacteroidia bacterium]
MANIITARNIVKRYAQHTALNDVSINVPEGTIYGLLGPNGAGKTSMIRIINQITAPDSGEVLFYDEKLAPKHSAQIGYLPEERGLYKKMKVGEQALYLAQLKGMEKNMALQKLKEWFKKFEIISWWDKKVEELSKGMAQKVQFIVTVLHEPKLLILDEPFSGFDPVNIELIRGELLRLRSQGSTILLSTHNMASVEELCNFITLVNHSKVVLEGSVHDLKQKHKEHIWEVKFTGDVNAFKSVSDGKFTVLDIEQLADIHHARVKIPDTLSPNDLLKTVMPVSTIHGLSEILPSMSEIFISAVKQPATT